METVNTRRPLWSLRLALPIVLALVVAAVIWHQNSKPTAANSPPGPPDARDLSAMFSEAFDYDQIIIRRDARNLHPEGDINPLDTPIPKRAMDDSAFRFGYTFDRAHHFLDTGDEALLKDALSAPSSLIEWMGEKACGFYPDYSIEFRRSNYTYMEIHFCFTCQEAKLHAKNYFLIVDLSRELTAQLKEILPRARLAGLAPPGQNPATPTASPPPSH